ncbi:methylmalonyl-CoA epimerase [bacterium]|nr:methylmalonyl-CoA epimerase [bacterium]
MLKKLDHIGIAVDDLDAAIAKYRGLTGNEAGNKEVVEEQKVVTAFFPVGEVRLELLKGTDPSSPITKFLKKRGQGIHHICFEVEDLNKAKKAMTEQGLQFIEDIPDAGASGSRVAFIHPKSTGGILMELVEYPQTSE